MLYFRDPKGRKSPLMLTRVELPYCMLYQSSLKSFYLHYIWHFHLSWGEQFTFAPEVTYLILCCSIFVSAQDGSSIFWSIYLSVCLYFSSLRLLNMHSVRTDSDADNTAVSTCFFADDHSIIDWHRLFLHGSNLFHTSNDIFSELCCDLTWLGEQRNRSCKHSC